MATARITQEVAEVIRTPDTFEARNTQMVVEVIRLPSPLAHRVFPILQPGRVFNNGGGTRVFPIPILG